jgi:serine/threonine protein phosphatase PrpC
VITLRAGSATDVGRVRSVNEDLAFVGDDLYGVADGMGGHAGGDVAARTAVDALQQAFRSNPTIDGLLAAVQEANAAVWERGNIDVDLRGMGTTITVVANVEASGDDAESIVLVNVGDSRAYLLRSGDLEQLTHDHSVAEELVARGELTPDQAALHPQRHILTRALGVAAEVDVDAWEFLPRTGDRYLLCSDGLSNELTESEMASILESAPEPARAAEELVRAANEHGGSDNITAVVLDVVSADAQALTPGEEAVFSDASESGSGLAQVQVALTRLATSHSPGAIGTLERTQAQTAQGAAPKLEKAERARDRRASSKAAERRARAHATSERGSPIITGRLLVFIVAVIAVLAGAWGVVRLYLNSSYFLAVDSGQIVVDQGKPGGFLWFNPKVVERTGVTTSEVPSYQVSGIRDGSFTESSAGAAQALVRRMVLSKCDYDQGVPSATPTTSPPSGVPAIARCPSNPTPQVTPPPSTSTTASTSTTSTGSPARSTSTTATTGTTG